MEEQKLNGTRIRFDMDSWGIREHELSGALSGDGPNGTDIDVVLMALILGND